MEKNKRMTIIVSVLLILGSISLAYFVGKTLFGGKPAEASLKTANIENSTITVKGELEFDLEGILPGHKNVSAISVTAKGNNELIPYNLIWDGNNSLNTELNYTVYKVSEKVEVTASCGKLKKPVSGGIAYQEECLISNLAQLGEAIASGTILTGEGKTELVGDEFITSMANGLTVYYYVILEYPNKETSQNEDIGLGFDGVVTVEASDAKPDIEIMAMYIQNEETGEYEEADKMPTEGKWSLNEQSMCSNEAKPVWDYINKRFYVDNLTQSGTGCVLYFEKMPTAENMLAKLQEAKGGNNYTILPMPTISERDTSSSTGKLYTTEDNYGTSYVFRGNVQDNWVQFANKRWRIIRINGDGTLRLIYQCGSANCTDTTGNNTQINGDTGVAYKSNPNNDNTYVGYYFGTPSASDYAVAHKSLKTNPSDIAKYINDWYEGAGSFEGKEKGIPEEYRKYLSGNTGFCNDRQIAQVYRSSDYNTGYGSSYNSATSYAAVDRFSDASSYLKTQTPDLRCGVDLKTKIVNQFALQRDLFTTSDETEEGNGMLQYPVGLITADEVAMAGGKAGEANLNYYLYTNKYYWTMTPSHFSSSYAYMFIVNTSGDLNTGNGNVSSPYGVRPVINLKATTNFSGSGTVDDPYIPS